MWKQIISVLIDALQLVTFTSRGKNNRRRRDC